MAPLLLLIEQLKLQSFNTGLYNPDSGDENAGTSIAIRMGEVRDARNIA
jgi:hypothetical protein